MNSSRFSTVAMLGAVMLFLTATTRAENICQLSDTRAKCQERYENRLSEGVADEVKEAAETTAKTSTGTSNAATTLPTSSFTDFFNTLKVAANAGEDGSEDPEALAFEYNGCGLGPRPGAVLQCQLRARVEQPEINNDLKTALEAGDLDDTLKEIEDGFDVGDKITAGIFFSLNNGYFGRDAGTIHNVLFQELQNEAERVNGAILPTAREQLQNSLGENTLHLQELIQFRIAPAPADATVPTSEQLAAAKRILSPEFTFEQLPADIREAELHAYEDVVRKAFAYTDARAIALDETHYFDLATLVNNQPQMMLGAEFVSTDEFAGPDEFRAKFSLESGLINVNGFRRYQKRVCSAGTNDELKNSSALCLGDYLRANGGKQAIEASTRFALTVEYVDRKKYSVTIPDTTVAVSAPKFHSLIGSLVYGRYLNVLSNNDPQKVRIDVSASYEDVSNDPDRQDRGIASATLSRQLTEDWLLSLGLVYATKPEFRAEADKDLSLRLGFNYRILRKSGN